MTLSHSLFPFSLSFISCFCSLPLLLAFDLRKSQPCRVLAWLCHVILPNVWSGPCLCSFVCAMQVTCPLSCISRPYARDALSHLSMYPWDHRNSSEQCLSPHHLSSCSVPAQLRTDTGMSSAASGP